MKSKKEYQNIIEQIKADSQVGIDAPYTHAVIIDYLQQLEKRVEKMEDLLEKININIDRSFKEAK